MSRVTRSFGRLLARESRPDRLSHTLGVLQQAHQIRPRQFVECARGDERGAAGAADLEWPILDSTVIRAHPCAAGAPKSGRHGGQERQALVRSRGGFGTKIHAAVNGPGVPVRLILTPGQAADVSQAKTMIEGVPFEFVIEDTGYDSQEVVATVEDGGGEAVIPNRTNATAPRETDWSRYKDRNRVERFWTKAKPYRRVATRFEKAAQNVLAFVHVASIMILLR